MVPLLTTPAAFDLSPSLSFSLLLSCGQYEEAGFTNVQYHVADVLAEDFVNQISDVASRTTDALTGKSLPVVLLGMHLCGELSLSAIDAFHALPGTLPHLTLPHLTLPYLTLPHLTSPYLTLPYLT